MTESTVAIVGSGIAAATVASALGAAAAAWSKRPWRSKSAPIR
mgnify:CR=1 FL=1